MATIVYTTNDKLKIPLSPALWYFKLKHLWGCRWFPWPSNWLLVSLDFSWNLSFPPLYEQVLDIFIGMNNFRLSLVLSTPKPKHVELSLILLAFYSFKENWMTWCVCEFDLLTGRYIAWCATKRNCRLVSKGKIIVSHSSERDGGHSI